MADKEVSKVCPIMWAAVSTTGKCIKENCEWWLPFAEKCAVPLAAEILADSTICQNVFEESKDG